MSRRIVPLAMVALFLVALVSCAPPAPAPSPTPTKPPAATPAAAPTKAPEATKPPVPTATAAPVTLKFGTTAVTHNIGAYLAMEKGYFKEQGITVDQVVFPSAGDEIAPLGTGELDIAGMVISPAMLNAADRGVGIKLVANRGRHRPGFDPGSVMVRKDLADSGQVKAVADLKGKKIAITTRRSVAHLALDLMLAQAGLAEKDVADGQFDVMSFPNLNVAFANKSIAAAYQVEPFVVTAVQQGLATKWHASNSFFPGNTIEVGMIGFSPKMARDTDLGRRWMVAYLKGVRDYVQLQKTEQGKGEIRAAIAKYTATKDPKLMEAMETPFVDPNGAMDMTSMNFQYDWLVKVGAYEGKKTFQDLVDTSFIDYAVQVLGKYQ